MAWRRRYKRRSGGMSVARALALVKRQERKQKRWRRTKRYATLGRKVKRFLRYQGIKRGMPYYMSAAVPSAEQAASMMGEFGRFGRQSKSQFKAAASANTLMGRGKYSFAKAWRASVGKQAGRRIRDALVDRAVSGISGSGLYSGRSVPRGAYPEDDGEIANVLREGGAEPMFISGVNDETQGLVISDCEYVQDIFGAPSSQFFVEGFSLNPGLLDQFPRLAQIAANYEEYEFIQLKFSFRTMVDPSATNNTNGSTGTLILVTNYNPAAALFTNKEVMMVYHGAINGRCTDKLITHYVECDPSKNAMSSQKYIRTTPVLSATTPLQNYDLGIFQIGQANVPQAFWNQQIGELWVDYTVRLDKPRMFAAIGGLQQDARWISNTTAAITGSPIGGGIPFMSLFANATGVVTLSSVNATPAIGLVSTPIGVTATNIQLSFPDFCTGWYTLQIYIQRTLAVVNDNVAVSAPTLTGSMSVIADIFGGLSSDSPASSYTVTSGASGLTYFELHLNVRPVVAGVDNTVSLTITPAGQNNINQAYLRIAQYNPTLAQSNVNPNPVYINSQGIPVVPNLISP